MVCGHALFLLTLAVALSDGIAAPASVTVSNHSRPTACAEEDNVSLHLQAPGITRLRVEALPPPYLDRVERDATAPDFSGCRFNGGAHPTDPAYRFRERRVVLHDGPQWRIVGLTLPSFWRPQRVPLRIGQRTVRGIHLLQVFAKTGDASQPREVLVLYPADGYWRIKPVPAPRFGDGVYGSSFLLGPVVDDGRPVVNIASIRIETRPLVLHLRFADGGQARVAVAEASQARTALDVSFSPATNDAVPFATLRSMHVTPDNADVSEITWRQESDAALHTQPLDAVRRIDATDVRFGRSIPSRHNTSAPDIRFHDFEAPGR
ncbi:hypothetical protein ACSFA2_04655 [Variovorax sp. LT2P21]|uniref:hypothetical protein n=1 Tax=Variovorax sp. LT2P21 TaxID=3443731 RepID=UPI003F485921